MCVGLVLAMQMALPPGTLVDRVIAVVDKEVITHSELLREARVALVIREGVRAASADLPVELLAAFMDYLVDQLLVAAQARRLGSIDVSADEVEQAVERFSIRFGSPAAYHAFLRRFDISDDALRAILRRDIRNERYVTNRMRAWRAESARAEMDGEERYRAAVRRWLDELRMGVELRILNAEGELELQPSEISKADDWPSPQSVSGFSG